MKILVIEDNPDTRQMLEMILSQERARIIGCDNGADGLATARRECPDLILLDCGLPDIDGTEVCRRLKSDSLTSSIPVIMVSAKGDETDVVLGLGLGMEDYITKPFRPKELLARVKVVLRRSKTDEAAPSSDRIVRGALVIDSQRHEVTIDGRPVGFTPTEFRLLHLLASHPGRVFTRDQVLNRVAAVGANIVHRNIDVHVRAIRQKLGKQQTLIRTIRGIGYRFADERMAEA